MSRARAFTGERAGALPIAAMVTDVVDARCQSGRASVVECLARIVSWARGSSIVAATQLPLRKVKCDSRGIQKDKETNVPVQEPERLFSGMPLRIR